MRLPGWGSGYERIRTATGHDEQLKYVLWHNIFGSPTQEERSVEASTRFPWLSGLVTALAGVLWLIKEVIGGAISLINSAVEASPL